MLRDNLLRVIYCVGSVGIILLKFRGMLNLHAFSIVQVVVSLVLLLGVSFTKNKLFVRLATLYSSILTISVLLLVAFAWMGGALGELGFYEGGFAICAFIMTISAFSLDRKKHS